jgi:hypothetical protein
LQVQPSLVRLLESGHVDDTIFHRLFHAHSEIGSAAQSYAALATRLHSKLTPKEEAAPPAIDGASAPPPVPPTPPPSADALVPVPLALPPLLIARERAMDRLRAMGG